MALLPSWFRHRSGFNGISAFLACASRLQKRRLQVLETLGLYDHVNNGGRLHVVVRPVAARAVCQSAATECLVRSERTSGGCVISLRERMGVAWRFRDC